MLPYKAALTSLSLLATLCSYGQSAPADSSIIKHLESTTTPGGEVHIYQDARLTERIGQFGTGNHIKFVDNEPYISIQGYRIQVFSDNNQRSSKDEAFEKEQLIQDYDPQIKTYVTFTSPFWRLRAGNYRSYEEANEVLRQLKHKFPKFGKEMRIITESIELPLLQQP